MSNPNRKRQFNFSVFDVCTSGQFKLPNVIKN